MSGEVDFEMRGGQGSCQRWRSGGYLGRTITRLLQRLDVQNVARCMDSLNFFLGDCNIAG